LVKAATVLKFQRASYIRQLRNSIARRGFWQAIKLIPEDLEYMAYRLVRRFRRPDPEDVAFDREEQEFDRAMGMTTAPVVRLVGLSKKRERTAGKHIRSHPGVSVTLRS
jgi:hypothetical protein